jgi:methionyl-tRNA synthetase
MSGKSTYYVTTPIYYVNDVPHIGHAYTTLACDVLARFKRLDGYDVHFPDRHGRARPEGRDGRRRRRASAAGLHRQGEPVVPRPDRGDELQPRQLHPHDRAAPLRGLPGAVGEAGRRRRHLRRQVCRLVLGARRNLFRRGRDRGRSGRQAPRHIDRRRCEWVEEPSYFFRLSAWADRLLDYYEKNPAFIGPDSRRNEVMSFVKGGLQDLSVSRTSFSWGIPVPGDPKHIMYVWLDALTNYITECGYPDQAIRCGSTGRPTSTWSARTSSASIACSGRPS